MARTAASRADLAAEALDAFLRDRPAASVSPDPGQTAVFSLEREGTLGEASSLSPQDERGRRAR